VAAFFLLLFVKNAHAESVIDIDPGVYKTSVERWRKAISKTTFSSNTWMWRLGFKDRLHKNGQRDSIMIVPSSSIPDDITLVVWFHGLGGYTEKGFANRIVPQLEYLVKGNHSFALAIPEMPWSINTSTPRGRQGRVWKSPGALEEYIQEATQRLKIWAKTKHNRALGPIRIILIGHSAGGSALMSASVEGGLCRLKPEAVIWSDASYGYWLDVTMNSCVKNLDTDLHILVRKWDKPYKSAERAMKAARRSPKTLRPNIHYQVLDRKIWSHRKIGNNVFQITEVFPDGC